MKSETTSEQRTHLEDIVKSRWDEPGDRDYYEKYGGSGGKKDKKESKKDKKEKKKEKKEKKSKEKEKKLEEKKERLEDMESFLKELKQRKKESGALKYICLLIASGF